MASQGVQTLSSGDMPSQAAQILPVPRRYRKKNWGNGNHEYKLRETAERNQRLQKKKTKPQVSGINGGMSEEMAGNMSLNTSWDVPSPENSFTNSQYQIGSQGLCLSASSEQLNLGDIPPLTSTRRLSVSPTNRLYSQIHIHSNCSNERSHDYLKRSYSNSLFDPSSSDCRSTVSSIDPSLLKLEAPMLLYDEHSISMSAGPEVRNLRPRK